MHYFLFHKFIVHIRFPHLIILIIVESALSHIAIIIHFFKVQVINYHSLTNFILIINHHNPILYLSVFNLYNPKIIIIVLIKF
jgi:hypothetical protein